MKYFIYCRKSSQEEERQALSIESQLLELREFAQKEGLMVVKEYTRVLGTRPCIRRPFKINS